MAYKFSVGKYKHSGSLVSADSLTVSSGDVSLPSGTINTAELADLNVTAAKLAAEAVETAKIKDLNVTTGKLADAAVTNGKIAAGAVQSGSIAAGAIVDGHIASATITNAKLVNTGSVLGSTAVVLGQTVSTIQGLAALSASAISGGVVVGDGAGLTNLSSSQLNNFTADVRKQLSVTDTAEVDLSYAGGAFSADIKASALSSSKFEPVTFSGSVQHKMDQYLSGGDGISYAAGVIAVQTTGVVEVFGDKLRVNQSLAGNGIGFSADPNAGLTKLSVIYGSGSNTAVQGNQNWSITAGNGLTGDASGQLGAGLSSTLAVGAGNGIEVLVDAVQVKLSSSDALSVDAGGLDLKASISGNRTFTGTVTINNLNVTGTMTAINTQNLEVKDARILIASGTSAFSASHGIDFGGYASLLTADVDMGGVVGVDSLSSSLPLVAPQMKADTFYGSFVGAATEAIQSVNAAATGSASIILANAASAGFALELPAASSWAGKTIKVKKADGSDNAVTIQRGGTDTIDGGAASVVLDSPYAAVMFVASGSAWFIF